jgi:hypothetical protein
LPKAPKTGLTEIARERDIESQRERERDWVTPIGQKRSKKVRLEKKVKIFVKKSGETFP